jgi:hypothetical protein
MVLRPVVTYGSETWTLTAKNQQALEVFKRKVLRKIYGPKRDEISNEWRTRYNSELQELYQEPNITSFIRGQRLRWIGHVQRMESTRGPKRCLQSRPDGVRPRGRPKRRYMESVEEDLNILNFRDWRNAVQDRIQWRKIVWENQNRQV